MLYQELPRIEADPLKGWGRWLMPALVAGAAVTIALLLLIIGAPLVASAAVVLVGVGVAAFVLSRDAVAKTPAGPLVVGPDYALIGSALGLSRDPVALTTGEGSLLVVNARYRERFGGPHPPLELATDEDARQGLRLAQSMAWRDGAGCVAGIATSAGSLLVEVERVGSLGEHLLWRFPQAPLPDPLMSA